MKLKRPRNWKVSRRNKTQEELQKLKKIQEYRRELYPMLN